MACPIFPSPSTRIPSSTRTGRQAMRTRPGTRTLTLQFAYPPGLEVRIKTGRPHFFWCVCVCGGAVLQVEIVKCFCSLYIACIFVITLLCVSLPIINKPLLNVPARCLSFLSLTQHGSGLRISEAVCAVSCHLDRRGSGNSRSVMPDLSRNSDSVRTKSAEGVASPVVRRHGYLGILELDN